MLKQLPRIDHSTPVSAHGHQMTTFHRHHKHNGARILTEYDSKV